ncbi:hypothetical protein A6F68_02664 [Tsuneonella dongtanensis]|uniref:Lipoprotein n=1 Tax=Tsuneonella dongtanensis TaxID=692370 RepID=A0A1B2AG81_9SPHN|nr:hypothetical protein [Tsuneonella dongtanensis]ANY21157.1 hypothetical protein A6F68_02664 [Tsuneonella dongtanensis]
MFHVRSTARAITVIGLAVLLTGCLLWPGRFTSTLDLRKDGAFTFSYDGEIHLMALSKLTRMGDKSASDEFVADECYDDELVPRECTPAELAEQRKVWEQSAAERAENKRQEEEAARAMLGGIDPSDPAAAEELAAKLRRQRGWKRVEHKGDGLFDVSFALSGRIEHDFQFPTMEGFPMVNHFVALTRRADGTVRIEAPGFAPQASGNPFQGMLAGMGGMPLGSTEGDTKGPTLPKIDGKLTIVTDGEILANNTDTGPEIVAGGRKLDWTINARTKAAPTALIRLE